MGLDARTRYTKTVIKSSLIALLKVKPLKKVTVKEICGLAEINRATFYKYYRDVFDLVEQLEQNFLEELSRDIRGDTPHDFKGTFTLILIRIKADGELYRILFSENGDKAFPERIFDWCYQISTVGTLQAFPGLSPVQWKWLYYFIAQGYSGILSQWMEGGMAEPVKEVAEFADGLLQNILKQFERRGPAEGNGSAQSWG